MRDEKPTILSSLAETNMNVLSLCDKPTNRLAGEYYDVTELATKSDKILNQTSPVQ